MSTICKIDPTVRKARTRRRDTVRHLTAMGARVRNSKEGFALVVLIQRLISIVKYAWMTGSQKEVAFRKAMNVAKAA